jgi:hypothetical protein
MDDLALRIAIWSLIFGGAFLWDYRRQRLAAPSSLPRRLHRWRMVGWAGVGLSGLWFALDAAGQTRPGELVTLGGPSWQFGPLPVSMSFVSRRGPPERHAFQAIVLVGVYIVLLTTVLLHRVSRTEARSA